MSYWLLKSEPEEYSYTHLVADGKAEWDGVTAGPAQAQMRKIAEGDTCVIYHTGNERLAIGLATVVRGPYPDPTDPTGKRVWVDIQATEPLPRSVSLAELKADPAYEGSPLARLPRLSVVPLTQGQFEALMRLSRGG
jgi:predicted RNA-binding protein with PUA-like domain